MEEKIFNSEDDKKVVIEKGLLSFPDCPNKCTDGYYFEPYKHKRIKCSYCENKRKEVIKNNINVVDYKTNRTIEHMLNLPEYLNGINFDVESIITEKDKEIIKKETLESVYEQINEIMTKASIGDVPEYSIMINLGFKPLFNNLVYPLMMRYYLNGVDIAPYLNVYMIEQMRYGNQEMKNKMEEDYKTTFNELIHKDMCIVHLDTGARKESIDSVKGLMEIRAMRQKPTLILTEVKNSNLYSLITDEKIYNLAHFISIEYDKNELGLRAHSINDDIKNNDNSSNKNNMYEQSSLSRPSELSRKQLEALISKTPPKL